MGSLGDGLAERGVRVVCLVFIQSGWNRVNDDAGYSMLTPSLSAIVHLAFGY